MGTRKKNIQIKVGFKHLGTGLPRQTSSSSQWLMETIMHTIRHAELVSASDMSGCSNGFINIMNKLFVLS